MGIYISHCITEIYAPNRLDPMDRRAIRILGKEIIVLHQLHFNEKNQPIFFSIDYIKSGFVKLIVQRER